jgi:hypothetical protein
VVFGNGFANKAVELPQTLVMPIELAEEVSAKNLGCKNRFCECRNSVVQNIVIKNIFSLN